jgi:integrase
MVLSSVLQRGVECGRIPANPVRPIRKPTGKREHVVRPLAPMTVEQMRRYLRDRDRERDAVLLCVLAYAGLRPSEAVARRFGDIGERTLLVERSLDPDGSLKRLGQRAGCAASTCWDRQNALRDHNMVNRAPDWREQSNATLNR